MKKLFVFCVIITLILMSGCTDSNADNSKSERDKQILENVWTYVQETDMPEDEEWKNAWLNGQIDEIEVSDEITSYIDIDEKYHGQTILLVTPTFEMERMAYPRILVDPETKKVIDELPGE